MPNFRKLTISSPQEKPVTFDVWISREGRFSAAMPEEMQRDGVKDAAESATFDGLRKQLQEAVDDWRAPLSVESSDVLLYSFEADASYSRDAGGNIFPGMQEGGQWVFMTAGASSSHDGPDLKFRACAAVRTTRRYRSREPSVTYAAADDKDHPLNRWRCREGLFYLGRLSPKTKAVPWTREAEDALDAIARSFMTLADRLNGFFAGKSLPEAPEEIRKLGEGGR